MNTYFVAGLFLAACMGGRTQAQPTITREPEDQSVSFGATVRFIVTATSTAPPMTYQWRWKAVALDPAVNPSATTRQLSLTNVTMANAGVYDVVVMDQNGMATTSQPATLTVDPTFTKILNDPVAKEATWAEACSWGDLDGDGRIDLFITRTGESGNRPKMYRNRGDGSFVSETNTVTTAGAGVSIGNAWADFDNNGTLDLAVGECCGGVDKIYSNLGDGRFKRLLYPSFRADSTTTRALAWTDYDCDGFVDLFIVNQGEKPSLYHNEGGTSFARVTNSVLVAEPVLGVGCSWSDYNEDGYPDLFVTSYDKPGILFQNNRGGTFKKADGPDFMNRSWGCSWADCDNDGHLDLFVARAERRVNSLYRNTGDGGFTEDNSGAICEAEAIFSTAGIWGDYDNDGYLDLFVANIGNDTTGEKNFLFQNDRQGGFRQILAGSPANDTATSAGCAWGDYDDDGFLDLVVVNWNGFTPALYRNNGNPNGWLKLKLVGTASNRAAIGAKVRLKATIWGKSVWQLREVSGGGGYASQSDLRPHFGLGDAAQADTVRIEWPSGIVQELTNVASKQLVTITEQQTGSKSPPDLAMTLATDGAVHLRLTGDTKLLYLFEASTNLIQWTKIAVRTNITGIIDYAEKPATNAPARFYRATVP